MKKFIITLILLALFTISPRLLAQYDQKESLGLPGDNLNLYAVMKLFQESETLEGFERRLNDQNSNINNLDLNGDNYVDYIKVIDYVDGDVHSIVLQVAIDKRENQDVAVFTVQRVSNGNVYIQLIGDEELYGRDYIIEPNYNDGDSGQTPNPGYNGNIRTIEGRTVSIRRTSTVEIAAWPVVRFIFLPNYVTWHSSWYYDNYPTYWHPWQPYYWDYYYGYHYNWYNDYYGNYRRSQYQHYTRWNEFYYSGRRSYSPNVNGRIQAGNYKSTYSRPEQRKDGEAMYTRMHPEQNTRRPDPSSGNREVRRSDNNSGSDRRSTGTSANRRPTNTVTNGSDSKPTTRQNSGTTRRTPTSVSNTPDSRPTSTQNSGTTRRSPASVSNKPDARPTSTQNSGSTRRAPTSVTNKSGSTPANEQKAAPARQSRESSTNKVSTPGRRSNEQSKTVTPVKQSEKKKEAETAPPSRRR